MARAKSQPKPKPKSRAKSKPASGPAAGDPGTQLTDAALKLLAKTAWAELTLLAVAKSARIAPSGLQAIAPSKPALLTLILRRIGAQAAACYTPEPGTAHDRLFEVAMCWFDVLSSHRKAVRSLYDGLKRDPLALVAARAGIVEAGSWLLTLAEADTGPALPLRALGVAAAIGHAVPAWLDDGPDLAKTMASLDTDLRRGETILDRVRRRDDADGGAN